MVGCGLSDRTAYLEREVKSIRGQVEERQTLIYVENEKQKAFLKDFFKYYYDSQLYDVEQVKKDFWMYNSSFQRMTDDTSKMREESNRKLDEFKRRLDLIEKAVLSKP